MEMAGVSLYLPRCNWPASFSRLLGGQERWNLRSKAILLPLFVFLGMCCYCRKRKSQSPSEIPSSSMTRQKGPSSLVRHHVPGLSDEGIGVSCPSSQSLLMFFTFSHRRITPPTAWIFSQFTAANMGGYQPHIITLLHL